VTAYIEGGKADEGYTGESSEGAPVVFSLSEQCKEQADMHLNIFKALGDTYCGRH